MSKGVTVTSVLLGVFAKRSQLHWGAPQTRFYLSLHTMYPVPPETAPLCDTQPREGAGEFLVSRGFRWLEKDAFVFQQLLSSGIATPQFFWHPEPWFAWQYHLSLGCRCPERIPPCSSAVPSWISQRADCPLWTGHPGLSKEGHQP